MTENMPLSAETVAFRAEIKQLLNILIHSLYSEREIFLRELISNASDALSRMHFIMLTERNVLDPDLELKIEITTDPENRILTISDTGVGMTKDELAENLGTIAHSGVKAFLDAAQDGKEKLSDVIGQFGVGFYSVFMVADWVRVTSRSYKPDEQAAVWYATGTDTFTLALADQERRGTTVEIKLKEDAADFAQEYKARQVIGKHSDYVPFPIYVGEEHKQANRQTAIWRTSPRDVKEDEYNDFYKQFTLDPEPPLMHVHVVTDAPVQVYALLFIPSMLERSLFSLRREEGLRLYSRKVLIQDYTKELLPQYFRFIQGVVDSEDLPLNVSREMVQSSAVMARLKKILASQLISAIKDLSQKDKDKYERFWEMFGGFIKEGIATDMAEREKLYPMLRFKTNRFPEQWSSLNDYVGRMKGDQRIIYYLLGDDERSVRRSPHLDYFDRHGVEVITLTEPIDSFMVLGLERYEGFEFKNAASAGLELPEDQAAEAEEEAKLPDDDFAALAERFKSQLGERISDVRSSNRLSSSVARLVDPEGTMNQEMQRVYRLMEKDYETPKKVLELNPRHPILMSLKDIPAEEEIGKAIVEQVYESALLIEGLHPDPASMIPRIQQIMEAALKR